MKKRLLMLFAGIMLLCSIVFGAAITAGAEITGDGLPDGVSHIGNVQDNWAGKTVVVNDGVATVTEATGIDAALLGTPIRAEGYTVSLDISHNPNGGFNMISFADAWGIIPFGAFCDPTGFNTSHTLVLYWDVTPADSAIHDIALKVGYREKDSAVPGQNNVKNTLTSLGTGSTWQADKPFTLSVSFARTNPVVTITQGDKSFSQVIGALTSDLFLDDKGETYISVSNSGTVLNINNIYTEKISAPKTFDNGFDKEYKPENDPSATDGRYDYYLSTPIYADVCAFSFDMQVSEVDLVNGGWDMFSFAATPDIIPFGYIADPNFYAVHAFSVMYYTAENRFEIYYKQQGVSGVTQGQSLVANMNGTGLIDASEPFTVQVFFAGEYASISIEQSGNVSVLRFDGTNDLPAIKSELFKDANGFTYMSASVSAGNHVLSLTDLNNLPKMNIDASFSDGEYAVAYTLPEIRYTQNNVWGYITETTLTDPDGQIVSVADNSFVPQKIGVYTMRVAATDAWEKQYEKTFTFNVKDTTVPVITVENVPSNAEAGAEVTLPEGTASDNCDQSVTVQITVTDPDDQTVTLSGNKFTADKVGTYTVVYSAEDTSGNRAQEKTFTVTVSDKIAPVITVENVPTNAEAGAEVTLPEGTASDNCDQSVTVQITVTDPDDQTVTLSGNKFTADKVGIYTVVYSAEDASGNRAQEKTFTIRISVDEEDDTENGSENGGDEVVSGGCGSAVTATASVVMAVTLLSCCVLLICRRKLNW